MTHQYQPSCGNCYFMHWINKTKGKGNDIITSLVGTECHINPSYPRPLPKNKLCLGHKFYITDPNKLPTEFARKVAVILKREEQATKVVNSR